LIWRTIDPLLWKFCRFYARFKHVSNAIFCFIIHFELNNSSDMSGTLSSRIE